MDHHGKVSPGGSTSKSDRKRKHGSESGGRGFDGGRGHQRGRGSGRGRGGRGRAHGSSSGRGNNFAGEGGERYNNRSGRQGGREHGRGVGRGNQGRNSHMPKNSNHNRHNNNRLVSKPPRKFQINSNAGRDPIANVVSAASSEASSLANDSDTNNGASTSNQHNNQSNKTITTLPWPNPISHYIPIGEEERLLPVLIHWGESERGMMKDQPEFRLERLQKVLEWDRNDDKQRAKRNNSQKHNNGNKSGSHEQANTSSYSTTQQISIIQSLSLRRHHLKLLNPRCSMSALRLGKEEDVRNAAALFEICVETYLRSHGVDFLSEDDQRKKFDKTMKGVPIYQRKQPPTPDFMMKDGHCVNLSLTSANDQSSTTLPTSINWIEAKMFYGASTIPSGTPNAVGCILPKMQQYVSLYGTGAIIFMYGCGSQLATQLLEVGVVALDGRCLDLEKVEKHQKKWCSDSWGNILF